MSQVPAVERREAAAAQAILAEPGHLVPQPLCDTAGGAPLSAAADAQVHADALSKIAPIPTHTIMMSRVGR